MVDSDSEKQITDNVVISTIRDISEKKLRKNGYNLDDLAPEYFEHSDKYFVVYLLKNKAMKGGGATFVFTKTPIELDGYCFEQ